jgi:hypothetical protein
MCPPSVALCRQSGDRRSRACLPRPEEAAIASTFVTEPDPTLASQLAASAERHARRALEYFVRNDTPEDFYLHAGTAIELAVKSRLAESNPAFLAPEGGKWFGPALALGRGQPMPPNLASKIASVAAQEAINRLRLVETNLAKVLRPELNDLLELRNHVAHLGWSDPPDDKRREHASVFVRAVSELLRIESLDWWGVHAGVASDLLRKGVDGARSQWELKRAVAQQRIRDFGDKLAVLVEANDSRINASDLDVRSVGVTCPVCGALGVASGDLVDEGEPDFEHEDGETVAYWAYDLRVVVDQFDCGVCGLRLVAGELDAADMETSVESPDATPADIYSPDDY